MFGNLVLEAHFWKFIFRNLVPLRNLALFLGYLLLDISILFWEIFSDF
jgi:hypothetical protein